MDPRSWLARLLRGWAQWLDPQTPPVPEVVVQTAHITVTAAPGVTVAVAPPTSQKTDRPHLFVVLARAIRQRPWEWELVRLNPHTGFVYKRNDGLKALKHLSGVWVCLVSGYSVYVGETTGKAGKQHGSYNTYDTQARRALQDAFDDHPWLLVESGKGRFPDSALALAEQVKAGHTHAAYALADLLVENAVRDAQPASDPRAG